MRPSTVREAPHEPHEGAEDESAEVEGFIAPQAVHGSGRAVRRRETKAGWSSPHLRHVLTRTVAAADCPEIGTYR